MIGYEANETTPANPISACETGPRVLSVSLVTRSRDSSRSVLACSHWDGDNPRQPRSLSFHANDWSCISS